MPKKDQLDPRLAASFAWRMARPGEVFQLEDEGDDRALPEPEVKSPETEETVEDRGDRGAEETEENRETLKEYRARARIACAALAASVDRAWTLPAAALPEVVEPMLRQAEQLGLGLGAMQYFPLQSVRLLRLALRCWKGLSPQVSRNVGMLMTWLDYDHPELAEVLVECTLAGAEDFMHWLALSLSEERWQSLGRDTSLVTRLARLVDEGQTYGEKIFAARLLGWSGGRAAIPALRRALRKPCFRLRSCALFVFDEHMPEAIEAEDVCFLVEDAILHPPPQDALGEHLACDDLPRMLHDALVRLRPRGAIEPLRQLANYQYAGHYRPCLDEWWAIDALAAAFPEEALPMIDAMQRNLGSERRLRAVRAAGHLPGDLAWPRLLRAAADCVPSVVKHAEDLWRKRRAEPCPCEPTAGLLVELLEGPPSERMLSRLEVLRRAPREARAAMAEVLLGEAPSREALVLLLFASDSDLWPMPNRPSLPQSREDLCQVLVERFGAPAVEGAIRLDALFPEGRYGWLVLLSEMLAKGLLPGSTRSSLLAAARRRFEQDPRRPHYSVLDIFAVLGPPADLFEPLWSLARDARQRHHVAHAAAKALGKCQDERIDPAVLGEMTEALATLDLPRFSRAAEVGLLRRLPEATTLTARLLAERGPLRPASCEDHLAYLRCVMAMHKQGLLPETWRQDAFSKPGTHLFAAAAQRATRRGLEPDPEAMQAALTGDEPICAAISADALLFHDHLSPDDGVLRPIVARAPQHLQARLLRSIVYLGKDARPWWPFIEPLLTSDEPEVIDAVQTWPHLLIRGGLRQELQALYPRITDPVQRRELLSHWEEKGYWQGKTSPG